MLVQKLIFKVCRGEDNGRLSSDDEMVLYLHCQDRLTMRKRLFQKNLTGGALVATACAAILTTRDVAVAISSQLF